MIIPSLIHLMKFLETVRGRDDDDMVTITVPIGDLRALVESNPVLGSSPDSPTQLSVPVQG